MDAPKCGICGEKEWNHSCSGAESLSNLPAQEHTETYISVDLRSPEVIELSGRVDALEARVEKLETRKKYQRDYMRKKRA